MIRWVFNSAAALSLVSLSVVVLLWSRSLAVLDAAEWRRASTFVQIVSSSASLRLIAVSNMSGDDPPDGWHVRWWGHPLPPNGRNGLRDWFGRFSHGETDVFRAGKAGSSRVGTARYYEVPYWLVAGASAALSGLIVRRAFQRRRRRRCGLCPSCGYDVRASPDCCPECGTVIPATSAS